MSLLAQSRSVHLAMSGFEPATLCMLSTHSAMPMNKSEHVVQSVELSIASGSQMPQAEKRLSQSSNLEIFQRLKLGPAV